MGWWGRRAAAATAALAAAGLAFATLGTAAPANADTDLRTARAKATALREVVDKLQADAEAASEDYGEANAQLDAVVTQLIVAEQGSTTPRSRLPRSGRTPTTSRRRCT